MSTSTFPETRVCPNAYKGHPHYMRQDPNGSWYCPLERAAEYEQIEQERARLAERRAAEASIAAEIENLVPVYNATGEERSAMFALAEVLVSKGWRLQK